VLFSLAILRGKNYTTVISKEIFTNYYPPSEDITHTTVNPQRKKPDTTVITQPTKENPYIQAPLSNILLQSSEETSHGGITISYPQRKILRTTNNPQRKNTRHAN